MKEGKRSMLEPLQIHESQLRACMQEYYHFNVVTLEFLPLGLDFKVGVYRAVNERAVTYFIKISSRPLYEPRYIVPRYLHDQQITAIAAPIANSNGALWTRLEGLTVVVYPFIAGESSFTGMTDEQWVEVGSVFRKIHSASLPPTGFESLRHETFDSAEYVNWIDHFETEHLESAGGSRIEQMLRASWTAHQPIIHTAVTALVKLSELLRSRSIPLVLCHADLHPANVIRDEAGQVFVIDWDEVMLAPKERDFIFVNPPQSHPFFQGYGMVEIDWTALTYYVWERVIQDLIECAGNVCFDDLGEEAKSAALHLFQQIVADKGGHIDAALAAAEHL